MPPRKKNADTSTPMNEPAKNSERHPPERRVPMRRRSPLHAVWSFLIWLVGVIVALAIGFAMTNGRPLDEAITFLPVEIHVIAGWIVVVLVLLGVILKVIDKFSS